MHYGNFDLNDWIVNISEAIEYKQKLDEEQMRYLVEFLTKLKSAIYIEPQAVKDWWNAPFKDRK